MKINLSGGEGEWASWAKAVREERRETWKCVSCLSLCNGAGRLVLKRRQGMGHKTLWVLY